MSYEPILGSLDKILTEPSFKIQAYPIYFLRAAQSAVTCTTG
eukprot:SAG11_NODE_16632_length_542_cov_0.695260_1_plen_41_part_10